MDFTRKVLSDKLIIVPIEKVTGFIDEGYPVDVLYLDFGKAFDKVPHERLLLKMRVHGIGL